MPDPILLDLKMPGMNGQEFAREFHARYDHQVPIVLLTTAENVAEQASAMGIRGWIGKPFDLDALVAAVGRELSEAGT